MKILIQWGLIALTVIAVTGRSTTDRPGIGLHHRRVAPTGARDKCTLRIFSATSVEKRDGLANETLARRAMTLPANLNDPMSIHNFVYEETGGDQSPESLAELPDHQRLLHWHNANGAGVNTAEYKIFEDEPNAFGMHLVGLVGCTGLLILSKKGLYMAHYWENIAFNIDDNSVYSSQDKAFEQTVLRGLRRGVTGKPPQGVAREQDSLQAVASRIDHESIHGFLIIPTNGASDTGFGPEDPYRNYWNRIYSAVGAILPRLSDPTDPNRWTEHKYIPVEKGEKINGKNPIYVTARGRLLVKFAPDDDGNGNSRTFVGIEHTAPQHGSMTWDPRTIV